MKFPAEEVPSRRFHLVEDGEDKYAALGKQTESTCITKSVSLRGEFRRIFRNFLIITDRLLKRSEQTLVNILLANNYHQPDLSEVFFWWPRAST